MKILASFLIIAVSTASHAAGFDGPYARLGFGANRSAASLSGDNHLSTAGTATLDGQKSSGGGVNGLVALGYSRQVPGMGGFNLAAEGFYIIGDQYAGVNSRERFFGGVLFNRSYTATLTNTYGISLEPGWNFSESTLGYLKLAWLTSTIEIPTVYVTAAIARDYNVESALSGPGFGAGFKHLLTKNVFAGVDLMAVIYPKTVIGTSTGEHYLSASVTPLLGFASVGYKF